MTAGLRPVEADLEALDTASGRLSEAVCTLGGVDVAGPAGLVPPAMAGSVTADAAADLALRLSAAITLYAERVTELGSKTRDSAAAYRAADEASAADLRRLLDR